jgi:hypothetical protein
MAKGLCVLYIDMFFKGGGDDEVKDMGRFCDFAVFDK